MAPLAIFSVVLFVAFIIFSIAIGLIIRSRNDASDTLTRKEQQLYHAAEQIILHHAETLARQQRVKVHNDVYGEPVYDDWFREVRYFVDNVLLRNLWKETEEYAVAASRWLEVCKPPLVEAGERVGDWKERFRQWAQQRAISYATLTELGPEDIEIIAGDGESLERACVERLQDQGWNVTQMGGAGDQGVDILATKHGVSVAIQCKNYSKPVGNSPVQEVFTGRTLYSADHAVVVAPNGYTPGARKAAESTGVYLLDLHQINHLDALLMSD